MFFSALYKLSQLGSFMCRDSTCSMLLSLLKARLATEQCQPRVPAVGMPLWCSGSYMAPWGHLVKWATLSLGTPFPSFLVLPTHMERLLSVCIRTSYIVDQNSTWSLILRVE